MDNNLKDTYNKIAEDWHEDHKADTWSIEATDKFSSFIKKGGSILDIGCAGGLKSKYLVDRGFKVLGIDFSENLIEIAKREVPEAKFLVMDVNNIDALEETFDGIFMQAVLLHIPKKDAGVIIKKAVGKLNTGGYLYVAVKEKIEGGVDEEIKTDDDYGYTYKRFFSYFSAEELKEYFRNAGLEIVYENVMHPSRTARKSNWMQIIGKKI